MSGKKVAVKKTAAIDKVRASYKKRRRHIVIDKWEGLKLYFGPLTTEDMLAVDHRLMDDEGVDDPESVSRHRRNILLLIHKAENQDGSKAFRFGDEHWLRKEADYLEMERVIAFMYQTAITLETAVKESGQTAT